MLTGQFCQQNGTIRLEDGPSDFEGRVEICMRGQWQTVCNDFWGHNEALVVCRQLGFSTSGKYLLHASSLGLCCE